MISKALAVANHLGALSINSLWLNMGSFLMSFVAFAFNVSYVFHLLQVDYCCLRRFESFDGSAILRKFLHCPVFTVVHLSLGNGCVTLSTQIEINEPVSVPKFSQIESLCVDFFRSFSLLCTGRIKVSNTGQDQFKGQHEHLATFKRRMKK